MAVENYNTGRLQVANGVKIADRTRFTDVPYTVAAAQSAALEEGWYDVWSTTDCFIAVAQTATTVTSANGYLLRANNTVTVHVPGVQGSAGGYKLGAIRSAVDGTLSGIKVA